MVDKNNTKILAKDVDVFYSEKQALNKISMDIKEKEVTALIGPSGCGKSTFLRCINRMNDLIEICKVSGSIKVDNEEIISSSTDVVSLRSKIGMVFQKPNPFPKSIFDNVAYGPSIHGLADTKSDLENIVITSLKKAGLYNEVKDQDGIENNPEYHRLIKKLTRKMPRTVKNLERNISNSEYLSVNDELRGYGGQCLPKDIKALIALTKKLNLPLELFSSIDNDNQKLKTTVFKGMRKD